MSMKIQVFDSTIKTWKTIDNDARLVRIIDDDMDNCAIDISAAILKDHEGFRVSAVDGTLSVDPRAANMINLIVKLP